jgi:DNA-binding MarR family transcriptional regulator
MSANHLDCFFDLARANAVANRRFDVELGGVHGIGLGDLHLLHALDRAPERRLRRVDLARQLGVTPSGVTWMLRPLGRRRLVANAPSETDARVAFAVLTDAGQRLLADALPTARELAAEYLAKRATHQELATVTSVLARLG